ncbi:MAG: multicopper oxidase domain-containing protein [Candidatus Woesearchaeota archaeon]|nr:multicopper oxidase domain-containing protein [Candidatus Woesearchaeota archaeon]
MADIPGRLKLILLFIIGSMLVMFIDGLVFDNYNSRESMAMMHMDMKPVIYADPAPPSQKDYWEKFHLWPTDESDPDTPLEPEILIENGKEIKFYRIVADNVLHELRAGVKRPMFSFNNQIPAPTLRLQEGDHVRVEFYNNATEPHTIHWHGINNIKNEHDGVPDVTQEPVLPGETFIYEFIAEPSGTKAYHCHVDAPHHINMGMFGAIIIDPKNETVTADREYTLILTEFDKKHAHVGYPGEMMPMGPDGPLPWLITPGRKFMMPFKPKIDEFLINGKSFPYTKPLVVKEGEWVRIRFVNMGSMPHSIHIHGHEYKVTHRDGFELPEPFHTDTLLIGSGERYDAWFEANNPGLWIMHDHGGLGVTAGGYDPAGMLAAIAYEGHETEFFTQFLERAHVYTENIEHMDDDHGRLTPATDLGGHGMEMGEGGH